ncbi:MAG: hypothetical protein AB7F19_02455 [Candidatus Babeliales bacterium]
MHQFFKKVVVIAVLAVAGDSICTEQKSNEEVKQRIDQTVERAYLIIHGLAPYRPGATDSIKAHARTEMREMYRNYTLYNRTTGYIFTCGYVNEILAKAAKQGLNSEAVMNLAQENVELFSDSYIQNRRNPRATKEDENRYATLMERAILIRQLICQCGQQQGLYPKNN